MAWIYRQSGRKTWLLAYRVGGKLRARSTKTTDEAEAKKQLAACRAMEQAHAAGLPLESMFREFTKATAAAGQERTLRAEIADWIAEAKGTTSPATVARYRVIAEGFAGFLNANEKKPLLRDVKADHVRDYLADLLARKSIVTANQERRCLRVLFRRAVVNGQIPADPVASVRAFKAPRAAKRTQFTVDEVRLLLSKANDFWRFAILCGFYTGLRISDIAEMPVGAADLAEGVIRITTRKTGTAVALPVPSALAAEIRARVAALGNRAKPTDFLWPEHAAMRSGARSNQFHALLVSCGLAKARSHQSQGKGRDTAREASAVSFHSFRHGFVSSLKAAGAGQAVARALAGHSSDAMSDHYTSLPLETLRDAVSKLPALTEGGGGNE